MTEAEMMILEMRGLIGKTRTSCQILCEENMKIRPLTTVICTGARDPGHPPERKITPPARLGGETVLVGKDSHYEACWFMADNRGPNADSGWG